MITTGGTIGEAFLSASTAAISTLITSPVNAWFPKEVANTSTIVALFM